MHKVCRYSLCNLRHQVDSKDWSILQGWSIVKASEYIMEIIVSIDFLYCSYEYTCVRHVESLLNYYKCKYMAIVNVQQWKTSCKHWNLLTNHQKIGWLVWPGGVYKYRTFWQSVPWHDKGISCCINICQAVNNLPYSTMLLFVWSAIVLALWALWGPNFIW